jgi:hypothetical protein
MTAPMLQIAITGRKPVVASNPALVRAIDKAILFYLRVHPTKQVKAVSEHVISELHLPVIYLAKAETSVPPPLAGHRIGVRAYPRHRSPERAVPNNVVAYLTELTWTQFINKRIGTLLKAGKVKTSAEGLKVA